MVQDIEIEMRKHSTANSRPVTNTNIDYTSSQMVISDQARKGEEVKTIGDEIGRNTPAELKLDASPEELGSFVNDSKLPT